MGGATDIDFIRRNYNVDYSNRVVNFLSRLGMDGYILVSEYIPKSCVMACSIGFSIGKSALGMIFVDKSVLEKLPRECQDFILAHELIHIIKNHSIMKLVVRYAFQMSLSMYNEIMNKSIKNNDVVGLIFSLLLLFISLMIQEADANTVKRQELEADATAAQLIGCGGTSCAVKFLLEMKNMGVNVSHVNVLGLPALTIDERINNLKQLMVSYGCRT
jgi:Zn-dependent protease with chaperone function